MTKMVLLRQAKRGETLYDLFRLADDQADDLRGRKNLMDLGCAYAEAHDSRLGVPAQLAFPGSIPAHR